MQHRAAQYSTEQHSTALFYMQATDDTPGGGLFCICRQGGEQDETVVTLEAPTETEVVAHIQQLGTQRFHIIHRRATYSKRQAYVDVCCYSSWLSCLDDVAVCTVAGRVT